MGEILRVDLDRLRTVADRVWASAEEIGGMQWPGPDPGALAGSATAGSVSPTVVTAQLEDVVADMRGWVLAARDAADAFERADHDGGGRIGG